MTAEKNEEENKKEKDHHCNLRMTWSDFKEGEKRKQSEEDVQKAWAELKNKEETRRIARAEAERENEEEKRRNARDKAETEHEVRWCRLSLSNPRSNRLRLSA